MRLLNICCGGGGRSRSKTSHLLWFLILTQFLSHSSAFFFPMFSNFFGNGFRNNQNAFQSRGLAGIHEKLQNTNGGVSIYSPSTASSNQSTSIRVPMFQRSVPAALERRVNIVTTVINPAPSDVQQLSVASDGNSTNTNGTTPQVTNGGPVEVHQNVSTTFPDQTVQQTSQRFVIPTKTSVTSSITAIQNGVPVQFPAGGEDIGLPGISRKSDSLPLQFTPNMFGLLSFVQAMKDIKRNYKDQEMERKMEFHNKQNGGGDLMMRILRTLIQKVVNKHQKHTEFLKLKIRKKEEKMQSFLQLPMVAQVIAFDEARAGGLIQGQQGAGVVAQPKSMQFHPHPHQQLQNPHQNQHPHQHPHQHQQHPHQHQQHPHQHQQHHQQHQQHHQQQQQQQGRRLGGPLRNILNSFLNG